MRPLQLPIGWFLVAVGVIGGSLSDPAPQRPIVRRGPYRVLQADLHTHTRLGDGLHTPFELVLQARRHGLDVIAVTEHAQIFPAQLAAWFSRLIGGPRVLVGQEVTTRAYHLLAVGLRRRLDWRRPLGEVIDEAHGQGAVVIAAHPVRRYWPALLPHSGRLDGVEVFNPLYHRQLWGTDWRMQEMTAFFRRARRQRPRLAAIGSSDYHFFKAVGAGRTLIFVEDDDPAAIIAAIRAGRTVVQPAEGKQRGDPRLLALLARAPIAATPLPSYAPRGTTDAVCRLLGWVGLLCVVLLRPLSPSLLVAAWRRRRGG